MEGWADIFCSRRWCSAEAKQQGAVKRLELKQQSSNAVFQDNDGNEVQQDYRRAREAECQCQEESRPGGGGQGEAGQVDDRACIEG